MGDLLSGAWSRLWPLDRHLRAAIRALQIDDRPLRDEYARRAHWTVADMRDRLAEPGDHLKLVWPRFEDYAAFVFASVRRSRRLQLGKTVEGGAVHRRFRYSGISDFDVVTVEQKGRLTAVEFHPNLLPSPAVSAPLCYCVSLD